MSNFYYNRKNSVKPPTHKSHKNIAPNSSQRLPHHDNCPQSINLGRFYDYCITSTKTRFCKQNLKIRHNLFSGYLKPHTGVKEGPEDPSGEYTCTQENYSQTWII